MASISSQPFAFGTTPELGDNDITCGALLIYAASLSPESDDLTCTDYQVI